jgi:hypothetical protein
MLEPYQYHRKPLADLLYFIREMFLVETIRSFITCQPSGDEDFYCSVERSQLGVA